MITHTTYSHGTLTIAIQGRIDSSKAQLLEDEINNAIRQYNAEMEELVLDADEMTFISSLGLRCILALKKTGSAMQIVNCCEEVYNTFKMTGFTRMMTITKALPRIHEEDLQPADGFQHIFRLSDDTVVKVFPPETPLAEVQREVQQTREIFIWGAPTAMPFNIVRVRDSHGIILEQIERKDISAETLAVLLRDFHQHIIEPDKDIPSAVALEKQRIKDQVAEYGEENASKMLRILSSIPQGSALLHGHLTLQDIAFSHNGTTPVVMNLGSVRHGNPVIDITHLYASLPADLQTDYFDRFLRAYYDNESESDIERIKLNITTLTKAYRYLEEGTSNCWDDIFFNLHFTMDFAEKIRELERGRFYLDFDINIDWVANALGTNRHYVSDYFNKVLGTSFSNYINNLRLEHAVHLLKSGRTQLSDIAYSAGFNNDRTFRRLFKQKYGCSPSQYHITTEA